MGVARHDPVWREDTETCTETQHRWNLPSRYDVYRFLKKVQPFLFVEARLARDLVECVETTYGWDE